MKPLSEVLETIKPTAEQTTQNSDTSNMPAHGLTIEAGMMITQSELLSNQQANLASTSGRKLPSVLRDDLYGKVKLSNLLLICFDTLDNYGKEPDQLENINLAFQMFLGDYSYQSIEGAFKKYMKESTTMPKPADIIKIIERPVVTSISLTEGERAKLEEFRKRDRKNQ